MDRRRAPLSATIICMNEADQIAEAIASVRFADEVLVVDSGSTDGTVELARAAADRVIERDWPGHVQQKNFAMEEARHEWVLSIDADERVSQTLRASIEQALENPGDKAGFSMNRQNHYLGRWIRHAGWYPDRKIRLWRQTRGRWGGENPHDRVEVDGPVGFLQGNLLHRPYDSIRDHFDYLNRYTTIAAEEKFHKGKHARWYHLTLEPPLIFLKRYLINGGFLDGWPGLVVSLSTAVYVFLKYAKLRELERGGGKP